MTHGPERARLRQYLSGARHEATEAAGENWRLSGILLQETARHMRENAQRVRDGDGTDGGLSGVTAQAVLEALHASAASMQDKGARLVAAGGVLNDAARVMRNAQTAEAAMTDLQQPAAYTPPNYSPGYTPTAEQIRAEGDKRQDANQEMADYNTARTKQEAAATEWTQKLDAVFLESIPTMQAIHGQPDPTEPPPSSPSSPSSPTSPSAPLTPSTPGVPSDPGRPDPTKPDAPDPDKDPDTDRDQDGDQDKDRDPVPPRPPVVVDPLDPTHPITHPTAVPSISTETTTVSGNQQSGVTYQGPQGSTPSSSGGSGGAGGMNAAALGAAGAAGGASGMLGGVRAGSASASAGSAPTRPIGATGRTGSAGALSRPAASSGSPAARSGTAGSPASRGAASGGTAGRGGAGSAGARGAGSAGSRAAGSAGARGAGSAGGRGAASGSTGGSRSGGRKGDRDAAQKRDSLVHDQDWLGDDDVAPGVLD